MSGKSSGGGGTKAVASEDQFKSDKASKGRRTAPSTTQCNASVALSKGSGGSQQSKASLTSSKSSGKSQQSNVSRRGAGSELKSAASVTAKSKPRKASAAKVLDTSTPERASKGRGTRRRSDLKRAGTDAETKEQADSGTKVSSGLKAVNPNDEAALGVEAAAGSKVSRKSVAGTYGIGKPVVSDVMAPNMSSKVAALADAGPNKTDGKASLKGGDEAAQSEVAGTSVAGPSPSVKPGTSDEVAANMSNKHAAPEDGGPRKADGRTSVKDGAARSRFSALKSLLRRKSLAVLNVAGVRISRPAELLSHPAKTSA